MPFRCMYDATPQSPLLEEIEREGIPGLVDMLREEGLEALPLRIRAKDHDRRYFFQH